jgi:RNA polymerase sigma-70 factor (ECF subfamily)
VVKISQAVLLWVPPAKFLKKVVSLFNICHLFRYINRMTQEEFTHIASEMRANAVSVALKCGATPADAEDIAQDVMLKLWYLHEKMDDATRMKSLVAITTRHVCIDRWRTARTHAEVGSMMPLVDEGSLYDRLEYAELEQWMNDQIDALPNTSRIVLTMRQLERRELSEIADILGIKQTSVSTLLARARNELMNKLKRRNQR